jgi:hypothetical protein
MPRRSMPPPAALPKQLQFILKHAEIPIQKHEACLQMRAVSQMTEYLKVVNMRAGTHTETTENLYDLSELLGFVNSHAQSP